MKTVLYKKIKIAGLGILLLFNSTFYAANVIFDLGGVLVNAKKSYMVKQVGFYSFLFFLLRLNNPFSLRSRLTTVLETIPAKTENTFGATDDNEKVMPNIMCDWLTGAKSSEELVTQVNTYFENNPLLFYNNAEKKILNRITNIMFLPEIFAKSIKLIKDGLAFVKTCKEQGHNIFVLSNWDKESFEHLCKKMPELFSLFEEDHIIISGEIGLIKPDPDIYKYVLQKYNLNPQECIFFDDQEVNIKAAEKFGIHGVICKNMYYKKMVKALDSFIDNLTNNKGESNEPITISV